MKLKLKPAGLGILGGVAAGLVVYNLNGKAAPACVLDNGVTIPDSTQTFWQALKGAAANWNEDSALTAGGVFDLFVKYESLGLIDPNVVPQIYSWWNNLTPEEQDAVNNVYTNGGIQCVEGEAATQAKSVGFGILGAVVAGLLVYGVSQVVGVE